MFVQTQEVNIASQPRNCDTLSALFVRAFLVRAILGHISINTDTRQRRRTLSNTLKKIKKMQLFFKTLDHKTFSMEVDMEGAVENIISKLEDDLGQDNLYKLISAGKLLKEDKLLSDYNISNKIPSLLW